MNDRLYIENKLNEGKSFKEIDKYFCKDPSTISSEAFRNRSVNTWNRGSFNNPYNFCVHRFRCRKIKVCNRITICDTHCRSCHICNKMCSSFEKEECNRIIRVPYVCNGCDKPRNKCPIFTRYDYNARAAHRLYEDRLVSSRQGINLSKKELRALDAVVRALVNQGQSPYMIVANHPELGVSVNTLYNYIHQGVLLTRDVDLKRKALNDSTLYLEASRCFETKVIKALQLRYVAPDDVMLSPKLLSH